MSNNINAKSNTAKNKSDEKRSSDSTKKIKNHAEENKANNSPNKIESKNVKLKTITRKKIPVEILGDSMLNGIQQKGLN